MPALAERLLAHLRREEFLHAGDRVGVAVSGGIDSVALLRLLLDLRHDLGIVLSVVHFNHKLRGAESDADEQFVADLACEHKLEFHCDSDDVASHAAEEKISIEQVARDLRYGFFAWLLGSESGAEAPPSVGFSNRRAESAGPPKNHPLQDHPSQINPSKNSASQTSPHLNKLATAHTLDDQAETVLMRLIRGTGLRGLRGIHPRIPIENDDGEISGEIIRPLLTTRRRELERYLNEIGQHWREDSTNADAQFTRNRVRKLVLPLLEREFNSAIAANLAELSELARGEEDYWDNETAGWFGTAVQWSEPDSPHDALVQINSAGANPPKKEPSQAHVSISRPWLLTEPLAVQRRVIKAVGDEAGIPLEFKHIEEILRFAAEDGPSGKGLALPLGWKVVREPESLIFRALDPRQLDNIPQDYEYELSIPGRVFVPETSTMFEALPLPPESSVAAYNPDHLLDAELVPRHVTVRNWRPGDRFWPAHTKSPKKIKELLQERRIAQAERKLWPVVLSGDEVIWLRGFAVPAKLRAKPGQKTVLIRELLLQDDDSNA